VQIKINKILVCEESICFSLCAKVIHEDEAKKGQFYGLVASSLLVSCIIFHLKERTSCNVSAFIMPELKLSVFIFNSTRVPVSLALTMERA